jgi:protein SCO1/2/putative membrane protein
VNIAYFPVINASLNGASAVFLLTAYVLIRARRYAAHATMMVTALVTSAAFLACYLTYHALRIRQGITVTHFPAGTLRPFYLVLLGSHTVLAVVILPLIAMTLWWATRRNWPMHRRISVWTFSLWLYVSVTGVMVYWMLYHVAPSLGR